MDNFSRRLMRVKNIILLPIAVVLADQFTKELVSERYILGEIDPIIHGLFNLTLAHNYGAAFGVFSNLPDGVRETALMGATLFAFGVLFFIWRSPQGSDPKSRLGISLVVSGAIGNIIDRISLGYVVDFLDFYVGDYHWPAFNIADSAISIGVILLLFFSNNKSESAAESGARSRT